MTSPPAASPAATLLGDQRPRIFSAPPALSSAGQEAVELAASAGLHLDPWQRWILDQSLGERVDGRWAASEVAVVVGRQNGKGAILEARELAGLFLFGERLILHTAHQFKTSSDAFDRIRGLVENTDALRKRVRRIPVGKGDEAIELRGGQRLRFIARSNVSGRGFTGDVVILDEAFELADATMNALIPTMSARSVEGNPQIWYTSSAVNQAEHRHGRVLARVRRRGHAGDPRLMYAEWSAGDREDLDEEQLRQLRFDRRAHAGANPGYNIRISAEWIEGVEFGSMSVRGFEVERLGIGDWPADDEQRWSVISEAAWRSRLIPAPDRLERPALAVAASWPDAEHYSIGAAGGAAGAIAVQLVDRRPGRAWVPGRLRELQERHNPVAVVMRDRGPTAPLHAEMTRDGFALTTPWVRESAAAFALFRAAAVEGEPVPLGHFGQQVLDDAVAAAEREPAGGDGWVWVRKGETDISPVEAVTLAAWGHSTYANPTGQEFYAAWR
jgi:hypothetical protein